MIGLWLLLLAMNCLALAMDGQQHVSDELSPDEDDSQETISELAAQNSSDDEDDEDDSNG